MHDFVRVSSVRRPSPPTMLPMFSLVWHYWIGVVLAVAAVATVGGLAASYLKSVESNRYPRES